MVVDAAYAACRRLAGQHYENFPVASRLLPRQMRPHIAAVYAFARIADDFADEGLRSDEARLALLEDWGRRLRQATSAGGPLAASNDTTSESMSQAVFIALSDTIRRCDLRVELLHDLLSAFRQDVRVTRYETWDDLLDYCRRSANPVGRLVLNIAGYRAPRLEAWSDAMCTALQLTNFWQDLERDWRKGRLYVPGCIVRARGASEDDLNRRTMTPAWQAVLRDAAGRTRELFETGRPVADAVPGRLRWELRATWLGGMRILDRLERTGFDVFQKRPKLDWRDAAPIAWRALQWSRPRATRPTPPLNQ